MAAASTPPTEQARAIFDDLGYSVSGAGREFRATRDWKEVRVTAVGDDVDAPADGTYRCFVAWDGEASALERRLRSADLPYEWAIIGVRENGDYEVARAP